MEEEIEVFDDAEPDNVAPHGVNSESEMDGEDSDD